MVRNITGFAVFAGLAVIAFKLLAALEAFPVDMVDKRVLDVG